jgi:Response regulators consisting of a CheY-like receiver domain and a winged-helix DNA-binding domain
MALRLSVKSGRPEKCPVLMMSAKTDDESKILGMEIGADDYVDKPFSIPVLTSKIKALMRRSYDIAEEKEILSAEGNNRGYKCEKGL